MEREAFTKIATQHQRSPPCILNDHWTVETELRAQPRRLGSRRVRWNEQRCSVSGSKSNENERDRDDQPEQQDGAGESAQQGGKRHALKMHAPRDWSIARRALVLCACVVGCLAPQRPRDVVIYASGS